MWSMFPAENLWHWLMTNARNKNSAEATMLYAWLDKQRVAMYFMTSLTSESKRYYYKEKFIAHSHMIAMYMLGKRHSEDLTIKEHAALIIFYTQRLFDLGRLWSDAVRYHCSTRSDLQLRAQGLILDSESAAEGGGFSFPQRSPLTMVMFWNEFAGMSMTKYRRSRLCI